MVQAAEDFGVRAEVQAGKVEEGQQVAVANVEEDPTTANVWEDFVPYELEWRGPPTIPRRFLQSTHWQEDQGS